MDEILAASHQLQDPLQQLCSCGFASLPLVDSALYRILVNCAGNGDSSSSMKAPYGTCTGYIYHPEEHFEHAQTMVAPLFGTPGNKG